MNAEDRQNRFEPLNDEEISRLMDPGLDPEERRALLDRLENDPESAEILALAGSKPSNYGLQSGVVEKVIEKVRENAGDEGICPHCAGDLVPGAPFCPQCGAQVIGNPLTCMKCGGAIREGSTYCPRCGSFFRSIDRGRSDPVQNQWFLPVLGIVSIIVAVFFRSMNGVFIVFLAIGLISLGAWGGEKWLEWKLHNLSKSGKDARSVEDDREQRKSG